MSKQMKQLMADELAARHADLKDCVFMSYIGVSASEADDLRRELRKQGARMEILRNRIAAKAFDKAGLPDVRPMLDGPTAVIYGTDIASLCRIYKQWSKGREKIEAHGGLAGKKPLQASDVEKIADLPSMDVLRGQMVGLVARQISGLAQGINSLLASIARAVDEIRKKKE